MSLEAISSSVAEAVAEAWGTLFMKTVGLSSGSATENEGFEAVTGSYVSCVLNFEGDVSGSAQWYIPKTEALTMVGMMMAMGADDELVNSTRDGDMGDEELDAIKEAFNQLCSTAATVIRDQKDCSVSGSIENPELVEIETSLSGGETVIPLTLSLEGFEDGTIYQVVSSELQTSLDTEAAPVAEPSASAPAAGQVDIQKLTGVAVNADLILAERNMDLQQLLTLCVGSVLEFWKPCDAPADLCIQDAPVANGEVVLCANQHFGMRILNLAPPRVVFGKGAN
jgi:flagellar motor switch/type III secretory pathway protein FliN